MGQLKNILKTYQTFREEDDGVASACDVRTEAMKAAVVSFSHEGLSHAQIDYFDAIIKQYGALYCDLLLDLKFTGVLFRQIQYELIDGLYWPAEYIEYPNADIRLFSGHIYPVNSGKLRPLASFLFVQPCCLCQIGVWQPTSLAAYEFSSPF